MVQLLHPHMTTEKAIALTGWTFVSKVMSLLFNMLSKLVIDFLPTERVTGRNARGLQTEEKGCKCQTFFISLFPLQCSCLENPRDGGDWRAAIYGVAQSRTRLKRLSSSSSSKCKRKQTISIRFFPLLYTKVKGFSSNSVLP